MERYNEFNKIQFLKEEIERITDFLQRKSVTVHKSDGSVIRGKFVMIDWLEDEGQYYLLLESGDSRDYISFECIKLKNLQHTFNGFSIDYEI